MIASVNSPILVQKCASLFIIIVFPYSLQIFAIFVQFPRLPILDVVNELLFISIRTLFSFAHLITSSKLTGTVGFPKCPIISTFPLLITFINAAVFSSAFPTL